MQVTLVLLAVFAVIATLLLFTRWYHSEGQLRIRDALARMFIPTSDGFDR